MLEQYHGRMRANASSSREKHVRVSAVQYISAVAPSLQNCCCSCVVRNFPARFLRVVSLAVTQQNSYSFMTSHSYNVLLRLSGCVVVSCIPNTKQLGKWSWPPTTILIQRFLPQYHTHAMAVGNIDDPLPLAWMGRVYVHQGRPLRICVLYTPMHTLLLYACTVGGWLAAAAVAVGGCRRGCRRWIDSSCLWPARRS